MDQNDIAAMDTLAQRIKWAREGLFTPEEFWAEVEHMAVLRLSRIASEKGE